MATHSHGLRPTKRKGLPHEKVPCKKHCPIHFPTVAFFNQVTRAAKAQGVSRNRFMVEILQAALNKESKESGSKPGPVAVAQRKTAT